MCLITEQKRAVVLRKDMIVYKVLEECDDGFYSPFQDFKWKWDLLYETKMGIKRNVVYPSYLFKGTYAFADKTACDGYSGFRGVLTVISEGFHACLTLERTNNYFKEIGAIGDIAILCFTIPAGAKVFRDATGLIVSDKIILKREDNEN